MRNLPILLTGLFAVACATPPFPGPDDSVLAPKDVAAAIAGADFVALGEEHMTPAVHRRHHELLRELYVKRPEMIIAMEMFERDVQVVLDQYLKGEIDEATFLAGSRPWPHYARDYRPVIEFAKQHGIPVLAANAPRELAKKASKEGVEAVAGNEFVARVTTAPEDAYWTAFAETMKGHEGMFGPGGMQRFYAAQCLKDDTMAESIVAVPRPAREPAARRALVRPLPLRLRVGHRLARRPAPSEPRPARRLDGLRKGRRSSGSRRPGARRLRDARARPGLTRGRARKRALVEVGASRLADLLQRVRVVHFPIHQLDLVAVAREPDRGAAADAVVRHAFDARVDVDLALEAADARPALAHQVDADRLTAQHEGAVERLDGDLAAELGLGGDAQGAVAQLERERGVVRLRIEDHEVGPWVGFHEQAALVAEEHLLAVPVDAAAAAHSEQSIQLLRGGLGHGHAVDGDRSAAELLPALVLPEELGDQQGGDQRRSRERQEAEQLAALTGGDRNRSGGREEGGAATRAEVVVRRRHVPVRERRFHHRVAAADLAGDELAAELGSELGSGIGRGHGVEGLAQLAGQFGVEGRIGCRGHATPPPGRPSVPPSRLRSSSSARE
ncbi:MAG: ChaN family lipoprotein [Planctomycetes bacterium]|nr:ChaN family lipoprotein [Planctomycetota bacterium]